MARQKNPQRMKNWAMISSGANYGRGVGEIVNRRATYLGASTTTRTFLKTVRPYGDQMIERVTETLSNCNKTVWMLDNNQRGHPLKFQRFGSSNTFVKVTGRTSRKCTECEIDIGEENGKHCVLTYVDQSIPNPINFPNFELEVSDNRTSVEIHNCMLRSSSTSTYQSSIKIDITGTRVSNYIRVHSIASTIIETLVPLLTGYNITTKVYKSWKNQPVAHITPNRKFIAKTLHSQNDTLQLYKSFQDLIVQEWNPRSTEATLLLIPPVSLRDEIKTDGYGMAIIEILCLSGVLLKVKGYKDSYTWELHKDWEEKTVYLCMDGLSLDRHRSFQKKLVNLPFSYHKSFHQSLIFQKSLSRVVEISGPLHIGFHMLQSIFVIYKDMIKWGKHVVDWKKVNVNKVSDSYDTCRRLCMMLLQELERLSIDLFLDSKYSSGTYCELTMSIDIAKEYSSFLRNNSTTDQRRQYMFGFIIMATEFRKYWKAVRCGDRIVMEQIQNIWIGVHLLSGKHKCVVNYLTGVETEYGRVSNTTLQEIRMNISCRYHAGNDK